MPVGYEQCRERKGYDDADKSEQCAPYGERKKEYGRVEPHRLTHDFGCDHHVGDYLNHDEQSHSQTEYHPEVLPRVGRLEHGEEGGGDECKRMQIGDKVHNAYEYAQTYCHREVHDAEPYAEHDAHAQRHHTLSAYVVVEFTLHILRQFVPERAVLHWEDAYPVGRQKLVIEQNEEHI